MTISPPYREKFIENLWAFHDCWEENKVPAVIDTVYTLCERIAAPPFSKDDVISDTLPLLLNGCSDEERRMILEAPDQSLRQLEKACRRDNDERQIRRGLRTLKALAGDFTRECFLRFPASLLRTAKHLGGLNYCQRRQVLADFKTHEMVKIDWSCISAEGAALILRSCAAPGITNPMPRRLKDFLAGSARISDGHCKKYLGMMREKIPLAQLELLEYLACHSLLGIAGPGAYAQDTEHALKIMNFGYRNRRAFRRFIKAYLKGNRDYLQAHPLTLQWLSRHPLLDFELWCRGISFQQEIDLFGVVTLALEQDPMEALKLGTYVGSCLGLGGGFSYSALAVVLDANKQVIYAREEYTISTILSQEWWDDGPWNFDDDSGKKKEREEKQNP
jgi:hypothetical protein